MSEPDWADEKAREWLDDMCRHFWRGVAKDRASLAALPREDRKRVLAEVRRVVEAYTWPQACRDEILRRLEKLK